MLEAIEEQQSQSFDMARIVGIVRRRHIFFLVPLFVGWLAIWGSSWFLPARYKSSTLILVEQPTMPKNYVEPNVNENLQDRLQSITQQILSRTRLLLIIDKLHLYTQRRQLSPDEKVAMMRKDIDIELVRDPQNQAITAFRVFYTAPDPHIAQQVTGELTNLFIDESLRVRAQESENTTDFIQGQLAGARSTLSDQEEKIRAFQAAHEGALPTQQATNLQILSGLQAQLQNEQDALNAAKQQRVYIQSMVDQYRTTQGTTRTTTAGAPTGLAGIDQQIDTLTAKLADLSTRYTDQYPEVQQVKAELAKAEKQRTQLVANLKSRSESKQDDAQDVVDPVQNGPLLQLQGQLHANQTEITNREQAITDLKSRINQYQARLSEEPAVEQQLADLTRGYDTSKANFDDLLKKENDSKMATSMEQMQEGERFTMLDPPSLPLKADFPNHLKMCVMGLGAGFALGLVLVAVLEFFDDRMYGDTEIQHFLSVAVIGELPAVSIPSDARKEKMRMALGWSVAGVVFVTILAGTAVSYLRG